MTNLFIQVLNILSQKFCNFFPFLNIFVNLSLHIIHFLPLKNIVPHIYSYLINILLQGSLSIGQVAFSINILITLDNLKMLQILRKLLSNSPLIKSRNFLGSHLLILSKRQPSHRLFPDLPLLTTSTPRTHSQIDTTALHLKSIRINYFSSK